MKREITQNEKDIITLVGLAQLTMNKAEDCLEHLPRSKTTLYQPAKHLLRKYEKQLDEIYKATGLDTHELIHKFVCEFEENFKITVVD